jgi:hypothetical protein
VVAIELVKQRRCRRLCLAEVDGAVMIGIEELQEASRRARREALCNRAEDSKQHEKAKHFDGFFSCRFSAIAPAKSNT